MKYKFTDPINEMFKGAGNRQVYFFFLYVITGIVVKAFLLEDDGWKDVDVDDDWKDVKVDLGGQDYQDESLEVTNTPHSTDPNSSKGELEMKKGKDETIEKLTSQVIALEKSKSALEKKLNNWARIIRKISLLKNKNRTKEVTNFKDSFQQKYFQKEKSRPMVKKIAELDEKNNVKDTDASIKHTKLEFRRFQI